MTRERGRAGCHAFAAFIDVFRRPNLVGSANVLRFTTRILADKPAFAEKHAFGPNQSSTTKYDPQRPESMAGVRLLLG